MKNELSNVISFELEPEDNERLANLCGQFNEHIKQVEAYFDVDIDSRSNYFNIKGKDDNSNAAMDVIKKLYDTAMDEVLTPSGVQLVLSETSGFDEKDSSVTDVDTSVDLKDEAIKWRVLLRAVDTIRSTT